MKKQMHYKPLCFTCGFLVKKIVKIFVIDSNWDEVAN